MMRTVHSGLWRDFEARRDAFELVYDEQAAAVPHIDRFRKWARRSLSRDALLTALDAYWTGHAGTMPVDEFIRSATALDPAVQRTRLWRDLERAKQRGAGDPAPAVPLELRLWRLRYNHRYRWLRWALTP